MNFKIDDDNYVNLFGIELNTIQHLLVQIVYLFFVSFIWPLFTKGGFFIGFGIIILPLGLSTFVYSELIKSKRLYRSLFYGGLLITTAIFCFFIETSFMGFLIHYAVYAFFGYIHMKKTYRK
ncbi:hypothetical protein [Winogradskyella sp.]|uniref:hypothetical protein n=1 Tax=Winogradskyella sp. TaxID=1883156 RepID=UPI003BA92877